MEFMELDNSPSQGAVIKVIGVGGGGGNAINNMVESGLNGVTFIAANTDMQDLKKSMAELKIQMGTKLTAGLGAGANPKVGCESALESQDAIREYLNGSDLVFVTCGMGGGTGTGAAPVIAQIAKELGILTVGVVTKPFPFEGRKRMNAAEAGIAELHRHVDSLITIPNSRLSHIAPKNARFEDMLKKADEVLYFAVKSISDLITTPGMINLDFADVKTAMGEAGLALMGSGRATGEGRAREAATKAITSPLLEDVSIDGAKAVLINVTASSDMTMAEVQEAADIITSAVHEDANIIFGTACDESLGEELRITVIATGIESSQSAKEIPGRQATIRTMHPAQPAAPAHKAEAPRPRSLGGSPGGNLDIPTILRQKDPTIGMSARAPRLGAHNPGEDDFIFGDDDEFEIPSFIRKQAN